MTSTVRDVVEWCLGAGVVILGTWAALASRRYKLRSAAKDAELAALHAHLEQTRLEGQQTTRAISEAAAHAAQEAEENTKTVLKAAAQTLQQLATEQQVVIDRLERTYGAHPVLRDLMDVNFANAQFARRAMAITVLCGGSIGRRKDPATVYDVVRSAQGQIREYQRVKITSQKPVYIKPHAVPPLAMAIAELLDNAATYSKGDKEIHVSFLQADNGALCINIEDAGVGMIDEIKWKASAILSGETELRLSQLGPRPQFGFLVVGKLARSYGFHVDVTGTSAYGGARAVVRLPQDLWQEQSIDETPTPDVQPIRRLPEPAQGDTQTVSGLPKRGTRQMPIAAPLPVADEPAPAAAVPTERDSRAAGRSIGALQRGTLSGRHAAQPDEEFDDR